MIGGGAGDDSLHGDYGNDMLIADPDAAPVSGDLVAKAIKLLEANLLNGMLFAAEINVGRT